ncbi:MAG: glycosyltransferase family 2 protein [Sulfurimicrobium sp.]|nr:glycosyltransferase family 2 protein [Sulfurimicrobium sp.]MDO9188480.1 glycosyltransferase family 2 protein [Sulfurimicrobium sp.]MDP1705712.1 glycosyltransferase family 2 protein [Sulfurimicrobium sp.]MDP1897778.1 glycosyltransferase family 2 protein [Sulfurimicrobium sp.]MDP2199128.1 glycosyltransferase family 2 protein [Sulfurimicrobium sp.]
MQTQPFSVVLITLNAAQQLEACLQSVQTSDEIVVVDSGSNDDTQAIALKYGARFISQEWLGFGPQKQFAVEQARNDWVLCLDADERISENLRHSIIAALSQSEFHAYRMPRSNRFMGRYLRHGEGYPDWSLRLFDRRHACWSADMVHEKVLTKCKIGTLRGDLLHDSAEDLATYLDKQNRYTSLQAAAMYKAGRRARPAQLILSPAVRFVRFYIFRLGMLDGIAGLVHIAIGCCNSFIKYAKLIALQKGE